MVVERLTNVLPHVFWTNFPTCSSIVSVAKLNLMFEISSGIPERLVCINASNVSRAILLTVWDAFAPQFKMPRNLTLFMPE